MTFSCDADVQTMFCSELSMAHFCFVFRIMQGRYRPLAGVTFGSDDPVDVGH